MPIKHFKELKKEVNHLRDEAMFWHKTWIYNGKPQSGFLNETQINAKAKYKEIANLYKVKVAEDKAEQEAKSNKGKKRNIGRHKSLLKMSAAPEDTIQGNTFLLHT